MVGSYARRIRRLRNGRRWLARQGRGCDSRRQLLASPCDVPWGRGFKKCAVEVAERNDRSYDFFVVFGVDCTQNLHRATQNQQEINRKATGKQQESNRRQGKATRQSKQKEKQLSNFDKCFFCLFVHVFLSVCRTSVTTQNHKISHRYCGAPSSITV